MEMRKFSRRSFLAGMGAAAGWWMLPAWAGKNQKIDPNRFVLMADTHVSGDRNKEEHGCKPFDTFVQAMEEICALRPLPAGILIAGDCVYIKGLPEDYAQLRKLLAPVRAAGIPIGLALGNHDNRANFRAAFPEARPARQPKGMDRQVARIKTPHADWYLLDSLHKTQYTPGRFGEAQLDWLAAELDRRPNTPALLMAHHYAGTPYGENGLEDAEAFFKIIDARPQVKAYIFGHSHKMAFFRRDSGIHLVNLPANAWLFNPEDPRGWVETQLSEEKALLTMRCLDHSDARHGQQTTLAWR